MGTPVQLRQAPQGEWITLLNDSERVCDWQQPECPTKGDSFCHWLLSNILQDHSLVSINSTCSITTIV